MSIQLRAVIPTLTFLLISGCGGSGRPPPAVTIGGSVAGLFGKLVLQNNSGDKLTVTANGAFTFPTLLQNGASYSVSVVTQPASSTCAITNGTGAATANVTSVSVTCTSAPSTSFVPVAASQTQYAPSNVGPVGLFVISSTALGEPPMQITTEAVESFGVQGRDTLSQQGKLSAASPYSLVYTTINSSAGDHVWAMDLSATSTLIPRQLTNLTIPYYKYTHNAIDHVTHVCSSRTISRSLVDPSSFFVILSLPKDVMQGCQFSDDRRVLIRSSDSPATDPVPLPALSDGIAPLYRPDGTLAGLLAIDSAHNLNLYPDETFTNPKVLLTNAGSFSLEQEPQPFGSYAGSADPTYGFLLVMPAAAGSGPLDIYHVDYSGTISSKLYTLQNVYNGLLVDAHTLYYVESGEETMGSYLLTVGRISASGGPVLTLANIGEVAGYYIPTLVGLTGSQLVFGVSSTYSDLWSVLTVPADRNGSPSTIASGATGHLTAAIADGELFLTVTSYGSAPAGETRMAFSSEIIDVAGKVIQPLTPFSAFITRGAPVIQVRDIPTYYDLRGGQLYALDLSVPAAPDAIPLTTPTRTAYTLPTGTQSVLFQPLTATISIASSPNGLPDGSWLIYDRSTGVVAQFSIPNSTITDLMTSY